MSRQRFISACASAALFIASFIFFAFFYRGHLFSNEQYQMFQFTTAYFLDLFRLPGGFSAWCSRFLIQFFLFPLAGGLIYASAITAIQLLCRSLSTDKSIISVCASFIPALLAWAVMCKEFSQINIAVNIIFCLSCALVCKKSRCPAFLYIILTPVLYWLCGFVAVIFVASALSTRKWWVVLVSAAILLALPFVLRPYVSFDIIRLYKGFFYYNDPEMKFTWPWIAFVCTALYVGVFQFRIPDNRVASICVSSLAFAGSITAIVILSDFKLEEELIYSNLVRHRKWDSVIRMADKHSPMDKFSIANLNLALAMKGRLGEDMFKYIQCGTDGLIPPYEKRNTENLICSDIYYHMALPSQSQRYMFECKESIPSLEKGSRMYQRLAQTNSINRQFAASRKYLDALSTTLFYRKWAEEFDDNSKELVHFRNLRFHNNDFFFDPENIINELGALYQENPENEVAFQYAAAYTLLNRDLDSFKKVTSIRQFYKVPRSYQEAFLIVWTGSHKDLNGLPAFVSGGTVKRFERFVEAVNRNMPVEELFRKFGDSYWFYYYYNITG